MARYIKRDCSRTSRVLNFRTIHVLTLALFLLLLTPFRALAADYGQENTNGWTPTRHGLIINFEPGDQFAISTVIDGKEYFVCDYEGNITGDFNYPPGSYLKLLRPQGDVLPAGAIWTVDTALTRTWDKKNYALGGIIYTMWSIHDKTLITNTGSDFSLTYENGKNSGGWLATADVPFTGSGNPQNVQGLCDVAFVVPTNNDNTITADPENTLKRAAKKGDKFNGKMGVGFHDMIYREVYWFEKGRHMGVYSYANTGLVSFDSITGRAFQIGAKTGAKSLQRRLFRIYPLNKPFSSCSSYFFGWDVQDYKKYRKTNNLSGTSADSTDARKIYTLDHFHCMEQVGTTTTYQTDIMQIPTTDSAYFYVGYDNTYIATSPFQETKYLGTGGAVSKFRNIKMLGVKDLNTFRSGLTDTLYTAKGGAYGQMVVNTTVGTENLGVTFEPAGYFLKVSTGKNVRMIKTGDHEWTSEELWEITEDWSHLKIKTTLYTGPDFSETDKGADIRGWSTEIYGTDVDLQGGGKVHAGSKGLARITTNISDPNGHIVLIPAAEDRHVHYDNNGLLGAQIPDQYPAYGETTVPAQDARLKFGFNFEGWATAPDGQVVYHAGDVITLSTAGTLTLYAKGSYTGRYNVAFSFEQGGQRYFMTQPVGETERYVRPRSYTDWTNVYQGMGDQNNTEPNYLSTYSAIGKPTCVECELNEYVLYPHRDTLRGYEDSLIIYGGNYEPADSVSLGLYYDDPTTDLHEPNTIVANNTWAGLFVSSAGWPDYNNQYVNNTKLSSQYGLRNNNGHNEHFQLLNEGTTPIPPYIQYQSATNRFDGVATADAGTNFQISNIVPADAHYVVLPDTVTEEWNDEIVFDYHNNKTSTKQVWSKVIGKQLLAAMFVSGDTIYFHPNRDKIYTTAAQLRQSQDFRLTQSFALIRDSRAQLANEANKATIATTDNDFLCNVTSGLSSPIDLYHKDHPTEPIDVCDTLRITLTQSGISRIKKYYGRWSDNAPGLKKNADGSRYRDVVIRTKTYHYGAVQNKLVLTPEFESYNFSPLANQSQTINFTLSKVKTRQLMDVTGNVVGEAVVATVDTTLALHLAPSMCSCKGSSFTINDAVTDHVVIKTTADNTVDVNRDTLTVTFTMDGQTVTARVPLMQGALADNELIWSAVYNNQRYFILAGSDQLIFRQYAKNGANLVKLNDKSTALIKGSADAANTDATYITPWEYIVKGSNQIALKTNAPINRHFNIASSIPGVHPSDSVLLTYEYDHIHLNNNANYEEMVKLKYGTDYLVFNGPSSPFTWTTDPDAATVFYWGYLQQEYNLLNNGTYPSDKSLTFGYNRTDPAAVTTAFQAYREYSTLVNDSLLYLCREKETNLSNLTASNQDWKTTYTVSLIHDGRSLVGDDNPVVSRLTKTPAGSTSFTSTITPEAPSPTNVTLNGNYVNVVDTLQVTLGLQSGAPTYRFKGDWSSFKSISDATVKIPLVRKSYHNAVYDSLVCTVDGDEYNYTFPATIVADDNDTHTFTLQTWHREGTNTLDVDNNSVAFDLTEEHSHTSYMHLDQPAYAEIRLADAYGKKPDWCEISAKGANTITVKCTKQGIRSPRVAYMYIAYMVNAMGVMRIVHFRLSVSQLSFYQEGGAQTLFHSPGASGDTLMADGRQQVHENKRILYYYNPSNTAQSTDQRVELPIRERGFYGWWRWYEERNDRDLDVPNAQWQTAPTNTGKSWNFPYRIIGTGANTMGRFTVFHYPSGDYGNKNDPPAKSPFVYPPVDKAVVTYVADIGNYTDNLPLSVTNENQIDIDKLLTMENIIEPTLSVRESFELHPWTEMAARLDTFKTHINNNEEYPNDKYMEDHVVMAPLGNQLLLRTEQRYNYANLQKYKHSESLLGYYMKDDNWNDPSWDATRKDTMIWCGGWQGEVPCNWYTYNPKNKTYTICSQSLTERDDFFKVPKRNAMTAGHEFDTLYYCLRARSVKTTTAGTPQNPDPATPVAGDYWFNICRYKIIYHKPGKYGPKEETNGVALITNADITQNYETLERLNFDYNKPGEDYTIYPHPLPWADGSYGYTYPISYETPHNRYHEQADFPGPGEYGIINKIPYTQYWRPMEQHGGAANGYMIYCDGMSSPGQVAALTLSTQLCTGQKMYFSGYVGNVSSQSKKANPNFTFSVQGAEDLVGGGVGPWEDITSYMTGDIVPSDNWYQIFFPISQEKDYDHYRIRIYNMADTYDGNDFVLDDMCVFATKPPLVAYQANTTCKENGENDSTTHVVLRIDYQGFTDENLNNVDVHYTIEKTKNDVTSSIKLEDGYFNEYIEGGQTCGKIHMPAHKYAPERQDSIFTNVTDLIHRFERTLEPGHGTLFRQGYVYEHLDDTVRPVMYVIHSAKIVSEKGTRYTVRMAGSHAELSSSVCAMTSNLKVTNRIVLQLNGEEYSDMAPSGLCANTSYDISLSVKGSLFKDSIAPIELNGSCMNDWLLYGDTSDVTSLARYGYKYSDIVTVITKILRVEPAYGTNANQKAATFAAISRDEMARIQRDEHVNTLSDGVDPYTLVKDLVDNGYLILYKSHLINTVAKGDSMQYVIFPIVGTGSDAMHEANVEVCPTPVVIKLKPTLGENTPLIIGGGGITRTGAEATKPLVFLMDEQSANDEIKVHIDALIENRVLDDVSLIYTNDTNFHEGVSSLILAPDKEWQVGVTSTGNYYKTGDTIYLHPSGNAYHMRPGFDYTFSINLQTWTGGKEDSDHCSAGSATFTISVVPNYARWEPKNPEDNQWNNPENWLGVNEYNQPIRPDAHYVPLASTGVIIPTLDAGLPYPSLPDPSEYPTIKEVGTTFNSCDYIRFMPGTAIAGQERLAYEKAIVDMSMPYRKWAFRSAPITGMLSGDVYMSEADLLNISNPWEVGEFDAAGRSYQTGNATFWMSVYNTDIVSKGNGDQVKDTARVANAGWSKMVNGMTLSLPPATGWTVFARTASGKAANVRLPKNDDVYYYYYANGDKALDQYEHNLRALRKKEAGGGEAGKLAFHPDGTSQTYTLNNGKGENDAAIATNAFAFGNPTMGYIDIWGFIADNDDLKPEFQYLDADGKTWQTVTEETRDLAANTIDKLERYLPPMHAIMVYKKSDATATSLTVTVNANRVVTAPVVPPASPAPKRAPQEVKKGIMTVTAVNPKSSRYTSRLLLGQGYNKAVLEGEDAMVKAVNIDNYTKNTTPAMPFNIYAVEEGYGLSIDLLDTLFNVPISFYMSTMTEANKYDSVTYLWFTGVNNIGGTLVLYDALTDISRPILDGICLPIETPEQSHQVRYFIRRVGPVPTVPDDPIDPISTDIENVTNSTPLEAYKIFYNGHVYIIRNGHVYTMFGQRVR